MCIWFDFRNSSLTKCWRLLLLFWLLLFEWFTRAGMSWQKLTQLLEFDWFFIYVRHSKTQNMFSEDSGGKCGQENEFRLPELYLTW